MEWYEVLSIAARNADGGPDRRIPRLARDRQHPHRTRTFLFPPPPEGLLYSVRQDCGRGELQVENLVLHGEEGELVQIPLPGTRAAKELMRELQPRIPGCIFAAPADGGNR